MDKIGLETYIKRLQEQYDEMLSYRERIQAEIDAAEKKLRALESDLIKAHEATDKLIKENKQLEDNFKNKNADRIKDLDRKEELLKQREESLADTKKALLTREIEVKMQEDLTKARGLDQDARDEVIASRERKCTDWETYLQHRTGYLEGFILEAETKENTLKVSQGAVEVEHKELEEARARLSVVLLEVQKREDAVRIARESLEQERMHLESQQTAFKLAVEEAKRRWPTLK